MTQKELVRSMHQNLEGGLINFSDMAQLVALLFDGVDIEQVEKQMSYHIEMNNLKRKEA
jgi:hypothetical protein